MRTVVRCALEAERRPRAIVAQCSEMMKSVAPLFTVLQFFKRWKGKLAKLLADAGFGPEHPEHERTRTNTEALLGVSGSAKLPVLVETVVALLLGLAKSARGLILQPAGPCPNTKAKGKKHATPPVAAARRALCSMRVT